MIKIYIYLLILLFAAPFNVFAQQNDYKKPQVVSFFPMKQKINSNEDEIEIVKKEFVGFNFEAYAALANEAPDLCNNADCQKSYKDLITMKYLAEGRCEEIKDPSRKEFCTALNNNSCDTLLNDHNRIWCKALLEGNPAAIFNGKPLNNKPLYGAAETKSDLLGAFGIFLGIKNNSYMSCAKYMRAKDVSFSKRYACRIIFSSNPSDEVSKIKRDLALFILARRKNNSEYCNLISDTKIKKDCLDNSIKKIEDM